MRQRKKHDDERSVSRRAPAGVDERKGKTKQPEGTVSDHKSRLSRNGHTDHKQSHHKDN